MTPHPVFDPWRDRQAVLAPMLTAREAGATLRQAAAAAGVHVATVCRWALQSTALAAALDAAERAARQRRFADQPLHQPRDPNDVPMHPQCPECREPVQLRRSRSRKLFYWYCGRCGWTSWRPRHPADCPACGGPRFWSHSRKSVHCPRCAVRTTGH